MCFFRFLFVGGVSFEMDNPGSQWTVAPVLILSQEARACFLAPKLLITICKQFSLEWNSCRMTALGCAQAAQMLILLSPSRPRTVNSQSGKFVLPSFVISLPLPHSQIIFSQLGLQGKT